MLLGFYVYYPQCMCATIDWMSYYTGCYQCSVCSQFSEFMWVIRRHIRSLHSDNPDAKIVDLSSKGGTISLAGGIVCFFTRLIDFDFPLIFVDSKLLTECHLIYKRKPSIAWQPWCYEMYAQCFLSSWPSRGYEWQSVRSFQFRYDNMDVCHLVSV